MDLAEVPIDQLVAEVSRRMHCLDKPEKRVIMVGEFVFFVQSGVYDACNAHGKFHGFTQLSLIPQPMSLKR